VVRAHKEDTYPIVVKDIFVMLIVEVQQLRYEIFSTGLHVKFPQRVFLKNLAVSSD